MVPKKIEVCVGDRFGKLVVTKIAEDVLSFIKGEPYLRRAVVLSCDCGSEEFTLTLKNLKRRKHPCCHRCLRKIHSDNMLKKLRPLESYRWGEKKND